MISINYQKQVAEAQQIRNRLVGENGFSNEEILEVDALLSTLLSDPKNDHLIVDQIIQHPYLKMGLAFSHGWYSDKAIFKKPESQLPRSSKARLVLFREYFMLSQITPDPWLVLNKVCDISPIHRYAKSDCIFVDIKSDQYFLHTSHTSHYLKKEEYDKIEKSKNASIMYPMYEGEVIAAVVAIVAAVFGVEYSIFRDKLRKKRNISVEEKVDELETIIKKQNEIITQMLLEMSIRNTKLLDLIDSNNGTVGHKKLKEIYFDSYLPAIHQLRDSKGRKCPADLLSDQADAREYANRITPSLCYGKNQNGTRCKRLVTGGSKYCWQHTNDEK